MPEGRTTNSKSKLYIRELVGKVTKETVNIAKASVTKYLFTYKNKNTRSTWQMLP